ncbi:MAG TPA: metallophosphoesterase [Candidatus Ozemobacteraceae bacterium]|nr:metallophosphoesterase [Candidatus Ozemobacteraceae bacterium]
MPHHESRLDVPPSTFWSKTRGHLPEPRNGRLWRGLVVSDLHLFREHSQGEAAIVRLRERIEPADFIVLNGDIFDFRWAPHPTLAVTEEAAVDWLRTFVASVGPAVVFYVMGNHDCHESFRQRLMSEPRLFLPGGWFPSFVRVGSALFLHGDLPLFRPLSNCLQRKHGRIPKKRGVMARLWTLGVICPLFGRLAPLVFPKEWSARQVTRSVRRHGPDFRERLADICFGHIHYPFEDHRLRHLRVHNSGAPLPGFQWQVVSIETADGDWEGA